ncbi:MAG: putative metal-binding motif-containing protein [Sandaracinaceae bacterium]
MRNSILPLLAVLVLPTAGSGCDETPPPEDTGIPDAGPDAAIDASAVCARNTDCEDSVFCTEHACMPGAPAADARGCVLVAGPCTTAETCVESSSMCMAATCGPVADVDVDGEDSIACGGDDCDDDDGRRFPGANEICDDGGLDEDCNPDTFASDDDGDMDDDGFTSALCCNGANCGDDCNDDDRGVFPGAREVCNGIDDDCDGTTDEEGGDVPLCPGGTCTAGRCDLPAWDRTFGGTGTDLAFTVDMDLEGNSYVIGTFETAINFGLATGPVESAGGGDVFIARFTADGAVDWVRGLGNAAAQLGFDIRYDAPSGLVYATVLSFGEAFDWGDGTAVVGTVLLALSPDDGTFRWSLPLPEARIESPPFVAVNDGALVVAPLPETFDFGVPSRPATGDQSAYFLRVSSDGSPAWVQVVQAIGAADQVRCGRPTASGSGFLVSGSFGGSARIADDVVSSTGDTDGFVVKLSDAGSVAWHREFGGVGEDFASAATSNDDTGELYVSGRTTLPASFGGTPRAGSGPAIFVLRLSSSGTHLADTVVEATDPDVAAATLTQAGDVLIAGALTNPGSDAGSVNFGGGTRPTPSGGAGFLATFSPFLDWRSDELLVFDGFSVTTPTCASTQCTVYVTGAVVGPADSTAIVGHFEDTVDLGSGARTTTGSFDGFIARLAR